MKQHLTTIAICLAGIAAAVGAAAQTSAPDIDLEAIRARAQAQTGEADALAARARERATAVTQEAKASASGAQANGRAYSEQARASARSGVDDAFDFDKMVADVGTMAESQMGEAPRFIAFASTSMPPAALRAMIDDTTRAGGAVVFRGLPQGSAKALTAALSRIARDGEQMENVGIDPRLFRAFGIEAVPAYVVTTSDFDLCDGFDCRTQVPPHDRMLGNVTAAHALETFAQGGGPGAQIAAQHLARLERTSR